MSGDLFGFFAYALFTNWQFVSCVGRLPNGVCHRVAAVAYKSEQRACARAFCMRKALLFDLKSLTFQLFVKYSELLRVQLAVAERQACMPRRLAEHNNAELQMISCASFNSFHLLNR